MRLLHTALFMLVFLLLGNTILFAEESDIRFQIQVEQTDSEQLTVHKAMRLALPTLWARVVPRQSMDTAMRLQGRTSLVLQFKKVERGALLVFNPVQVQAYLKSFGITMIPVYPQWDLDIAVQGFGDTDKHIAAELINYSYGLADKAGFRLGPRGRSLRLSFFSLRGSDGEAKVGVDISGSFSSALLSQIEQPLQGYLSYQLQAWLEQILYEVRDAYALGKIDFVEVSTDVMILVEGNFSLASQVSFEQILGAEPDVVAVVPVVLQKESQLYRIVLRGGDDSWLKPWFASHGLIATRQPESSVAQWLVQ